MTTGVQMEKLKSRFRNIILVSLSAISGPLQHYLDSMGVRTIVKPSLNQASQQLAAIGAGEIAL
jgi:hypothetical protein